MPRARSIDKLHRDRRAGRDWKSKKKKTTNINKANNLEDNNER